MSPWFVAVDGKKIGPMSSAELKAMAAGGTLRAADLAWREGLAEWVPAQRIKGLFDSVAVAPATVPPPLAKAAADAPLSGAAGVQNLTIAEDDGPFEYIGGTFEIKGGGDWHGATIVSPNAIYLRKDSTRRSVASRMMSHGNVVMAILRELSRNTDHLRSGMVSELPPSVAAALDPRGKHPDAETIILLRSGVQLVKVGPINNVIAVTSGDLTIVLSTGLFAMRTLKKFMLAHGWRVA